MGLCYFTSAKLHNKNQSQNVFDMFYYVKKNMLNSTVVDSLRSDNGNTVKLRIHNLSDFLLIEGHYDFQLVVEKLYGGGIRFYRLRKSCGHQ